MVKMLALGATGLGLPIVVAAPAAFADDTVHAYCIWDTDHFGSDGRLESFETYISDGEGATEEEAIEDAKAQAGAPAWDCHISQSAPTGQDRPAEDETDDAS